MYAPAHFIETDPAALHDLIALHPLSTLITLGSDGLNANPIPMFWFDDGSEHGVLRAHVARANPLWQDVDSAVETLAVFQGHTAYISPNWYPTKAKTHKVVPTYNYAIVQAYGELVVHDDANWVLAQITELTARQESHSAQPWQVADAPADYIEQMMKAIVGIELNISRISGKWKVSQNQPANNQQGVYDGLQARGQTGMADYVQAKFKGQS